MSTLNKRLKSLRTERNITQKEFAQNCDICLRVLHYYESGQRKPNADVIIRFCKYLDVSADYLLGLSDSISRDS